MVGILNFGTALGGLAGGWNQAQDAYLRQALSRAALQQQQRQQQAETLAALALMGGNIPGLGGFGGTGDMGAGNMTPLPTPPMPGASSLPAAPAAAPTPVGPSTLPTPSGAQPPMPQQAPAPSPTMGAGTYYGSNTFATPGTVGTGTGNEAAIPPAITPDPIQVETLSPLATQSAALPAPAAKDAADIDNTTSFRKPSAPDYLSDGTTAPGVPPPGGYGAGETVTAPGVPGARPPAAAQAAPPAPTRDTGEAPQPHVVAQLPNGQTLSIGDLFQTVNPQALARSVAATAPPGTDPAAIFEATEQLMKMANGNKMEQQQAAFIGKMLGLQYQWGERKELQDTALAAKAAEGAANRENRANIATQNRQAADQRMRDREGHIDARMAQREAFQAEQAAIRRGDAQTARRIQAIRAQIAAINASAGGGVPSKQQKAQLDALGKQLADIVGETAAPQAPTK